MKKTLGIRMMIFVRQAQHLLYAQTELEKLKLGIIKMYSCYDHNNFG